MILRVSKFTDNDGSAAIYEGKGGGKEVAEVFDRHVPNCHPIVREVALANVTYLVGTVSAFPALSIIQPQAVSAALESLFDTIGGNLVGLLHRVAKMSDMDDDSRKRLMDAVPQVAFEVYSSAIQQVANAAAEIERGDKTLN